MIVMDLLPYREMRRARMQRMAVAGALAILTAVGLVSYTAYQSFADRVSAEQAKVQQLQTQSAKLKTEIASIAGLRKSIAEVQEREQFLLSLQHRRTFAPRLFYVLSSSLSHSLASGLIWVSSLDQKDGNITISGYADHKQSIASLMQGLAASGLFGPPTLDIVSLVPLNDQYVNRFTFQMPLKAAVLAPVYAATPYPSNNNKTAKGSRYDAK